MKNLLMKQFIWVQTFLADQRGQADRVRHGGGVDLFAAAAGMDTVANNINTAFTNVRQQVDHLYELSFRGRRGEMRQGCATPQFK